MAQTRSRNAGDLADISDDAALLSALPETPETDAGARSSGSAALTARLRAAFLSGQIAPIAILRIIAAVTAGLGLAHLQDTQAPAISLPMLMALSGVVMVASLALRLPQRVATHAHMACIVATLTAWVTAASIGPALYIGLFAALGLAPSCLRR